MLTIINPPPPHRTTFPAEAGEVRGGKIVYADSLVGEVGHTDRQGKFHPRHLKVLQIDDKPINPAHLGRAVKEGR